MPWKYGRIPLTCPVCHTQMGHVEHFPVVRHCKHCHTEVHLFRRASGKIKGHVLRTEAERLGAAREVSAVWQAKARGEVG